MSRIGKKPVPILDGARVVLDGCKICVEGPKGKLEWEHRPEVSVEVDMVTKVVRVSALRGDRFSRAYHGLTRALVNNMIVGAKQGYEKRLEIVGVGYLAAIQKNVLQLRVGFCLLYTSDAADE